MICNNSLRELGLIVNGSGSGFFGLARYFDNAFVRSSEYFNNFLLRIGGLYSVKGRVFETPARDAYAIVGVLRSPRAGPLADAEVAQLASSLNGHLRRAAALHYKLAAARPSGRLLESAIDRLPFGIMVADARGKVLAANRAAQDMLQAGDGLVERNGVLQARPGATTRASRGASPRPSRGRPGGPGPAAASASRASSPRSRTTWSRWRPCPNPPI